MVHRPYPTSVDAGAGVALRPARDDDAELISGWTRAPEVHDHWGGRPLGAEPPVVGASGRWGAR